MYTGGSWQQMLADAGRCWQMLADAGRCWQMLADGNSCKMLQSNFSAAIQPASVAPEAFWLFIS